MPHIWLRAESRANETRAPLTPAGASALMRQGAKITVEQSPHRVFQDDAYHQAGCTMAPEGSWPKAPSDAIILGLKELPDSADPLPHRHIMFGHAFKSQPGADALLHRFSAGSGALWDLEYLLDDTGRRLVAFGYWAGFAGAGMALSCWIAGREGRAPVPARRYDSAPALIDMLRQQVAPHPRPRVLIIGALGRTGRGAAAVCDALDLPVTRWDMAETAAGGLAPEILSHDILLNCILAGPETPVFLPAAAIDTPARQLAVIGDIACDPGSPYSPLPLYDRVTTWDAPALRIAQAPPLDVTAIDNLPSMLPRESSEDFASALLPHLADLCAAAGAPTLPPQWARAHNIFQTHATPAKP
jgi:saccharopine dehydrogenase (NAD+, L-lysine-forming)